MTIMMITLTVDHDDDDDRNTIDDDVQLHFLLFPMFLLSVKDGRTEGQRDGGRDGGSFGRTGTDRVIQSRVCATQSYSNDDIVINQSDCSNISFCPNASANLPHIVRFEASQSLSVERMVG